MKNKNIQISYIKANREANFELLRIVAMFMIVVLHYLVRAQALFQEGVAISGYNIAGSLIESFCIVSVNVYVLISGYYLVNKGCRLRSLGLLWGQVWFYTLLIPVLLLLIGELVLPAENKLYHIMFYILPISTEHYWFMTAYVLMFLVMRFCTGGLKRITKRSYKLGLIMLFLIMCVLQTATPFRLVIDNYGYDFGWFIFLFLLGAYIRLYGLKLFEDKNLEDVDLNNPDQKKTTRTVTKKKNAKKRGLLVYVISALAAFALSYMATKLEVSYYIDAPFYYNFLFSLTGAVGLFYFFKGMKTNLGGGLFERICLTVAPFTLGVYLLHEHIDIRDKWFVWLGTLLGEVSYGSVMSLLGHLILYCGIIFVVGIVTDAIRCAIFSKFEKFMSA